MEQIVDDTATIQDAYKLVTRRLQVITTALTGELHHPWLHLRSRICGTCCGDADSGNCAETLAHLVVVNFVQLLHGQNPSLLIPKELRYVQVGRLDEVQGAHAHMQGLIALPVQLARRKRLVVNFGH